MPTRLVQDPRAYVQLHPLPIDGPHGVKVETRNFNQFVTSIPSKRQRVQDNYMRRKLQMSSQGYYCPIGKAYDGVGYPIHLDQKTLILKSLGQYKDKDELKKHLEKPSQWQTFRHVPKQEKPKIKYSKSKTGLYTLKDIIEHDRYLMKNVSRGHDFLNIMQNEKYLEEMQRISEEDSRKIKLLPGKVEDFDDSLLQENDDNPSFKSININSTPSQEAGETPEILRPFTPKYSNALLNRNSHLCSRSASFRQLCSLLWLLEAMNCDMTLTPVSQSWMMREKEIGGKRVGRDRLLDSKWSSFAAVPSFKGTKKYKNDQTKSKRHLHPKTYQRHQSNISVEFDENDRFLSSAILDASPTESFVSSIKDIDDNNSGDYESIFTFLDDYYRSQHASLYTSRISESKSDRDNKTSIHIDNDVKHIDDITLSFDCEMNEADRSNKSKIKEYMADTKVHLIRPKSSPALLQFQSKLPSDRHSSIIQEISQTFDAFKESSASSLHKTIDNINRNRLEVCELKYSSIPNQPVRPECLLHQLRARSAVSSHSTLKDAYTTNIFPVYWFYDLVDSLPEELQQLWYFKVVIKKLKVYSLAENCKNITSEKFKMTVKRLRPWELKNPDVAAAVDFCRERILNVPLQEYENWFDLS